MARTVMICSLPKNFIYGTLLNLTALARLAQHFPPLDRDDPPKSRIVQNEGYCMTARNFIALNSPEPLFTFDFAAPGATGSVFIDGKVVQSFQNQQHVRIHAQVSAGNHKFNLRLKDEAALTFMV